MNHIDGYSTLDMKDSLNGFINPENQISFIEGKFKYSFNDKKLLEKVLIHSSSPRKKGNVSIFERSELLGDKVLSLCLVEIFFKKYPKDTEGDMSIRLSFLSGKSFVSKIFTELELETILDLNEDCRTSAVYTDFIEAIIGAIFIDSNYETVKIIIKNIWSKYLDESLQKDSKSILQEFLQSKGFGLPVYKVIKTTGKENELKFYISVENSNIKEVGYGDGSSKKYATQLAAKNLLEKLNI